MKLIPLTENTITDITKLLTELAKIKKQGYAISLGERTPGLGALSAPILNHRGVLLAALSLAMPEIRFKDMDHRKFCLEKLLHIAKDLSRVMGYNDPD